MCPEYSVPACSPLPISCFPDLVKRWVQPICTLVKMQISEYGAGTPGAVRVSQCVNDIVVHKPFQPGYQRVLPAPNAKMPDVETAGVYPLVPWTGVKTSKLSPT